MTFNISIDADGFAAGNLLGVMSKTLSIPALLEEWLKWATWVSDPQRREEDSQNLTGFMEFDWVIDEEPEKGWKAILAALEPL